MNISKVPSYSDEHYQHTHDVSDRPVVKVCALEIFGKRNKQKNQVHPNKKKQTKKPQDLQRIISHKLSHLFAYALEPLGKTQFFFQQNTIFIVCILHDSLSFT